MIIEYRNLISFPHLSYDFQLLIWYLRSIDQSVNEDDFSHLFQDKINWDYFIHLATWHRVTRLIYNHDIGYIPPSHRAHLKENVKKNSLRIMKMTHELVWIAKAFHQANLPMISLKGPLLAKTIYDSVDFREPRDLDLFILYRDVPAAQQILMALGYQLYSPKRPIKNLSFYARYQKDMSYFHPQKKIVVELHWRLFNNPYDFIYPSSQMFEEAESEYLLGVKIAKMPRELELLYLLHHGQQHSWTRLCWLYDIKQYHHCYPSINPYHLQMFAKQIGVEHSFWTGMSLIYQFWHESLHPELLEYMKRNRKIQTSTQTSISVMSHSASPSLWIRWHMLMHRFPRRRMPFLFYKAFLMRLILRAIQFIPA